MEKEEDGKTRGWGQLFHLKGKKRNGLLQSQLVVIMHRYIFPKYYVPTWQQFYEVL